jgi:hypothetical protein
MRCLSSLEVEVDVKDTMLIMRRMILEIELGSEIIQSFSFYLLLIFRL